MIMIDNGWNITGNATMDWGLRFQCPLQRPMSFSDNSQPTKSWLRMGEDDQQKLALGHQQSFCSHSQTYQTWTKPLMCWSVNYPLLVTLPHLAIFAQLSAPWYAYGLMTTTPKANHARFWSRLRRMFHRNHDFCLELVWIDTAHEFVS